MHVKYNFAPLVAEFSRGDQRGMCQPWHNMGFSHLVWEPRDIQVASVSRVNSLAIRQGDMDGVVGWLDVRGIGAAAEEMAGCSAAGDSMQQGPGNFNFI